MQALIHVGIMFAPEVSFVLHGKYENPDDPNWNHQQATVQRISEGTYTLTSEGKTMPVNLPLVIHPAGEGEAYFDLLDVTIGIDFHWERKENQRFTGGLKIMEEHGRLTAINILPLEDYLKSVISSEMSATSSAELLKAHAVISRSWLLAQIEKEQKLKKQGPQESTYKTDTEHIRWYDREDHLNFHVCADDHCQRYQGVTRASTPEVNKAIDETHGQVLAFEGLICDARYSKCCGGISERFENVWEPVEHPYLSKVVDHDQPPVGFDTNLDKEENAHKWITGSPAAFCNTQDKEILSQVLNDYDQETHDFYRWEKSFSQQEITGLLKKRIGLDVGQVKDLIPVERGTSGRLIKLKVVGTQKSVTIGKELEIRKAFSDSHLYSSAFVISKEDVVEDIPQKFIFAGAGWGHGVGLCQIGAAVMGARGYTYKEILAHYFSDAQIQKWY